MLAISSGSIRRPTSDCSGCRLREPARHREQRALRRPLVDHPVRADDRRVARYVQRPTRVAVPRRPIGRLTGTVCWVITLTNGPTPQADAETARVGRFQRGCCGTGSTEIVELG